MPLLRYVGEPAPCIRNSSDHATDRTKTMTNKRNSVTREEKEITEIKVFPIVPGGSADGYRREGPGPRRTTPAARSR